MKKALFPFAILLLGCPSHDPTPEDIPRITIDGNTSKSCPDGQVLPPGASECVPAGEFQETVCDDDQLDVIQDVMYADYCCYTQNNYYYSCPMIPGYNLSPGVACSCSSAYYGTWYGITCNP